MFHIMVAEDDTNTRKLMCTVLKQNGYEPVPAVDGIDALDILDSCLLYTSMAHLARYILP